jgi:hypothetical protein
MVIVFVKEHGLCLKSIEALSDFKTTEATANYNNPGLAQVCDAGSRSDQFGHEFVRDFKTGANLASFIQRQKENPIMLWMFN